jgi:serine/threonine protein kinase/Flp pilus assembly protein TadD
MKTQESSAPTALAEEMAARWRRGERPPAEEFLACHPEIRDDSDAAIDLIYEEFCLRQEFRLPARAHEFLARFPQWREQLAAMLGFHRILEPATAEPALPAVGDMLGDFRLLAELGRGGRGRVYLATQPELADRPVVLKVTPSVGHEHLSLARLQHTHISPLYSVHVYPDLDLRALCMPYFGGTTLAWVLEQLHSRPASDRTGQQILDVLDSVQDSSPVTLPARGPARQFFAHAPYVQSICWLGACLADALHYAHERGLVHLDLKPSNVLITCDGQPMLLDFHLARAPIAAGEPAPDWLGGTAGYMSPEQQRAIAAVRKRRAIADPVDGRSDVYSLGLVLYEALGGTLPSATDATPARLEQLNPQVSTGLADLIEKCVAADPAHRFATAGALGTELRRHLADLPLREVANRSVGERWQKWRRRRPNALALANLTIAVAVAVMAAGFILITNANRRTVEARAALNEGQDHLDNKHFAESVDAFNRGIALSDSIFGNRELKAELTSRLHEAERARIAADLHVLADHVRFLFAAESPTAESVRKLEARCRQLWEQRDLMAFNGDTPLNSVPLAQVATDLLDLAILWADLRVRVAPVKDSEVARREAMRILDDAERVFGPSAVLCYERRIHAAALGLNDVALAVAERSEGLPPQSAWEHYALGRSLLAQGRLDAAAEMFELAVGLEPAALWPNFYQGTCEYRRGRFDDAALAFTACVGAAPDRSGCYYNRALAYTALGRTDRALHDYDRALQLDPALGVAALNRAILHYQANRFHDAATDLAYALEHGADPASVYCNLALVHSAQGDRAAALVALQRSLEHDPSRQDARTLQDRLLNGR